MLRPGRVLVVDDEPMIGGVLRMLLSAEHVVAVVHTVDDALDALTRGERFDAILCDVTMPRRTGADLFDALRERAPELCDTVVFMSGGIASGRLRGRIEATGRPVIAKPFDITELRAALRDRIQSAVG